jgi:hypothetical protein
VTTNPFLMPILLVISMLSWMSAHTLAQPVERSKAELTSMKIGRISLDTTARDAFNHLLTQGYNPGITRFDDWDKPRLEFIRGSVETPEGLNQVQLSREGNVLTNIVVHTQRPRGARFDIEGEINRARSHFNIPASSNACIVVPTMGTCAVTSPSGEMNYHQMTMAVSQTEQVTTRHGVVRDN